jgi:hypothetical protein
MADVWGNASMEDFQAPAEHITSEEVPFNFQSAYPGGVVEQKRLKDCATLQAELLILGWANTRELARQLNWSRRRVRATIKAMRGAVGHERCTGEHGAEEDRWRLKERR